METSVAGCYTRDEYQGASDSGMSQPVNASSLPICAGVGDPEAYVWACWDCVNDLCA